MDQFKDEQLRQVIRKYHSELQKKNGIIDAKQAEIDHLKLELDKRNPEDFEMYKEEN